MSERKEVYVLGHRNPDTDSICSAIAYADVKNKENDGNHYVAARAGQISSETSYVLQRFGMRQPTYVNNIGTRVRDMEIRKIPGINEGISMKKAWSMMAEMNAVTLPIVDANNVLDGIITINGGNITARGGLGEGSPIGLGNGSGIGSDSCLLYTSPSPRD